MGQGGSCCAAVASGWKEVVLASDGGAGAHITGPIRGPPPSPDYPLHAPRRARPAGIGLRHPGLQREDGCMQPGRSQGKSAARSLDVRVRERVDGTHTLHSTALITLMRAGHCTRGSGSTDRTRSMERMESAPAQRTPPPAHAVHMSMGRSGVAVADSDALSGLNHGPRGTFAAITRVQALEGLGLGVVPPRPGVCPGRRGRPGRQSAGRQSTGPGSLASGASATWDPAERLGARSHWEGGTQSETKQGFQASERG
jgi:hypothetical protein